MTADSHNTFQTPSGPRRARPAAIALSPEVLGQHLATPDAILGAAPMDDDDVQPIHDDKERHSVGDMVAIAARFAPDDPTTSMAQSISDTTSQRRSDLLVGGVVSMTPHGDDGRIDMAQFCVLFGRALRARRIIGGTDMITVARQMQVSKQYISHVERGKSSFMAMMAYALHLGVRPSSILRPLGL